MNSKRSYTYFEWRAAKFYYEDIKLHHSLDEIDQGFSVNPSQWNCGLKNIPKELNFHQLWEALPEEEKNLYRNLAFHDLYSKKEKGLDQSDSSLY
tara:strand:- start:171 stop:455 length:285 start_codon:yes stop_codon:yes gene_type:complete